MIFSDLKGKRVPGFGDITTVLAELLEISALQRGSLRRINLTGRDKHNDGQAEDLAIASQRALNLPGNKI